MSHFKRDCHVGLKPSSQWRMRNVHSIFNAKIIYFFFLSTYCSLNAIFRAAFQSAFIPSNVPSDFCLPLPCLHSGVWQIKVDWLIRCPFS